jgi:hypothetical protein
LPVDFVIDVSDPVDPATLDASEFTVNGTLASAFVLSNGNTTISFHFDSSPARQGVNTLHIAAALLTAAEGQCLSSPAGFATF